MEYVTDIVGVAAAIVVSMGLALWLEWLSLRGLMRLMPARPAPVPIAAAGTGRRGEQQQAA